jgi:hypothetical protein
MTPPTGTSTCASSNAALTRGGRESRGAGGASTTAEVNDDGAGDSPPQRRRREDARAARAEGVSTPDEDNASALREKAALSAIEITTLRAQFAEAHAELAAARAALPNAALSAAPMRQPIFE